MGMRVLYARCAGLDVHKAIIVACLLLTASSGKTSKLVRTWRLTLPLVAVSSRQATTVFLWTSSPAQHRYKTVKPIAGLLSVLLY